MASFTDIIPQFNPYIQQLPVEAMVSVGMEKQRRYDEGLQKIQSQVEKIAGLDVYRDVDKQYLQSKLNELGSNLKTVAAGDFSNFQLVNSVGGMVNQIGKDPNVQNAVFSTQWYRKQREEMDKAIQEGKSSIENIYDFDRKVQNWTSSTEPGKMFNERYTPYIDVKKKILTDVIGKINPNVTEQDIPWEMNADGTINTSKIAAVMTRVSGEAVTAEQLQNAINASLTPAELNQLAISGRYQFRDVTPEELSSLATRRFDANIKDIDETIAKLEGHANASKSDTVEYNKTLQAINSLKERKVNLSNQLARQVRWINENPEDAKAELYKDGFVNSFAEAFSWEKKKKQIIDNPYQDYKFKVADQRLKEQRLNLDREEFSWKKYMDQENLAVEKDKLNLSLKKFYGDVGGAEVYLGESTAVKDPLIAIKQDRDSYKSSYNDFVKDIAKDMNISLYEAETRLRRYQDGDKNAIRVDWRGQADDAIGNLLQSDRLEALLKKSEKEASENPTVLAARNAYNKDISKLPGANITVNGVTYKFSSKEISDYASKIKRVPVKTGYEDEKFRGGQVDVVDPKTLTDKEKAIYNILENSSKNPEAARTLNAVIARHKPVVEKYKDSTKIYNDVLRQNLLEKTGKYIPKLQAIMVSDKEGAQSRDRMENLANLALSVYTGVAGSQPGGAKELTPSQASDAKTWLTGKEKGDVKYSKLTQGDKTFLVMQKGADEIIIPLTPQLANQLPSSGPTMSSTEENIREIQQHFGGNTNPSNDPRKAYFQPRAFSSLNKLSVTADLQKDRSSALNYLNLNLKLPSGWKNLQLDELPMDVVNAQKQISMFTDNDILNIYLRSGQVPQEWKDEIIQTYQQK